jgi:hypothetical protein
MSPSVPRLAQFGDNKTRWSAAARAKLFKCFIGDPGRGVRSQSNQDLEPTNNPKSPIEGANVSNAVTNTRSELATMLAALRPAREAYGFNSNSYANEALRLIAGAGVVVPLKRSSL